MDKRARFEQVRYKLANHTRFNERSFNLPVEKGDPHRVEFYSNYPLKRVSLINCEEEVIAGPFTPTLGIDYRNRKYRSDAKFSSIDDKLFIYFENGNLYEDEDFLIQGDNVSLLGKLPDINAEVGNVVRYRIGTDFENASITEIAWSPALNAEGFLTDVDATILTPLDGLVEITYNEKPANLYFHDFDLSAVSDGIYYTFLEFGVADYTVKFTGEPIDIKEEHEDTLAIEYRHNGEFDQEDLWGYIYLEDWTNIIRMPARFYKFTPAGEVDVDVNDSGIPRRLRSIPFREMEFEAMNIPAWLADKLQLVFAHDSKFINGYYWENETFGNFEMIDNADLGTYRIALREVDDRVNFNNEFEEEITASWTPPTFVDLPFGGTVVSSIFNSNSLGVFSFVSLPDWITPNVSTFQNGHTVEFTIAANAISFDRTEILNAICPDFTGVIAPISFQQDFEEVPDPEFIEISYPSLPLVEDAGANGIIYVNASGPWEIVVSGPWIFTAVPWFSDTAVKISEPTANPGPTTRTGNVRVRLISNPLIFKDIAVSQVAPTTGLFGTEPTAFTFPSNGGNDSADVSASPGTQWQASSSQTWCIVDTGLHTGNGSISVFVNGRDLFIPAPRFAQITIVDIASPSHTLTIIVQQN
jgi:hypothetical protein